MVSRFDRIQEVLHVRCRVPAALFFGLTFHRLFETVPLRRQSPRRGFRPLSLLPCSCTPGIRLDRAPCSPVRQRKGCRCSSRPAARSRLRVELAGCVPTPLIWFGTWQRIKNDKRRVFSHRFTQALHQLVPRSRASRARSDVRRRQEPAVSRHGCGIVPLTVAKGRIWPGFVRRFATNCRVTRMFGLLRQHPGYGILCHPTLLLLLLL